ncbi:MAG: galactokinase [Candidatus Latescibacteria bacterium]|nr:galactokinase [Candidatus Latescibacterota bacterium]
MTDRIDRLLAQHAARYGVRHDVAVFRAPGRVNLIGEHTDYNDGFVLPVAIDRDILIAAAPRNDGRVALYAMHDGTAVEFALDRIAVAPGDGWVRYAKGVAAVLQDEGARLRGLEGVIEGTVPIGAGLSSSAALEVATALAFCAFGTADFTWTRLAQVCQRAENDYVGVRCGIMDQFIACLARPHTALFLDCRSLAYEHIPFDAPGYAVVIANTNRPRGLVDSAYNERRQECEAGVRLIQQYVPVVRALRDVSTELFARYRTNLPDRIGRRCEHVITENERVQQSVNALRRGNLDRFGRLMNASHDSLRDRYEVSCRELDVMVDIARSSPGVVGSRMTGAGFGGCTINLVAADRVDRLEQAIRERYPACTGFRPDVYVCQPAGGAERVKG